MPAEFCEQHDITAARAPTAADGSFAPVEKGYWLALCLAMIVVRGAWFLVDPTPMLFLGDSMSYIETALTGWIPPDRSFLYGFLVRMFAVAPGSLTGLLIAQAVCSVAAALLLAAAIMEVVGRKPVLAGSLALLWVGLEPLALLWERYVMAETFALPLLGTFIVSGLRYVRTRRVSWLLLANVAGIGVVALRLPFVSVAWVGAVTLPLIAMAGLSIKKKVLLHLLLSVTVTAALHAGYQSIYGALSKGPMGYQHAEGAFLLAAWAPLLEPEDFPDPALGRRVVQSSTCTLRDRRSREGQRWKDDCLVPQLEREVGSSLSNGVARRTALRLAWRDPIGVARLALETWLDFFDSAYVGAVMRWDRRETDYGERANETLAKHFALDGSRLPHLSTATNRLYFASQPWLFVLAASPLLAWIGVLANGLRHGRVRLRQGVWIAVVVSTLMGMVALTGMSPTPRFLHPLGWLAPIWIAELLSGRFSVERGHE